MGTLVSKVGNNNNSNINGSNSTTNVSGTINSVSPTSLIIAGYDIKNYVQAQKTTLPPIIKRRGSTPDAQEWDVKLIKKIILEKKLAAFFPSFDDITMKNDLEECPICFLYYPGGLNRAKCCKKGLCTECFIQIKKGPNFDITCPFCNQPHYVVYYSGPLTKEEKEKEVLEEQKVIELKMKMQKEEEGRTYKKEEHKESEHINIDNKRDLKLEEVFQQSFEERLKKISSNPSSFEDPGMINGIKIPAPRVSYPKKPRPGQTWAQLEEELLAEAISLSLLEQNLEKQQEPDAQNASERSVTSIMLKHDDETSNEFSPLSPDNSISTTGSYISLADRKSSIVDSPQNDLTIPRKKKSSIKEGEKEKESSEKSESSISSGEDEWEPEVEYKNKQTVYKNEKKSRIRLGIQDEEEKQLALAIQLSLNSSK